MFVSIDRPDFQGFAEQLDRIPDQLPAVCSRAVKRETGDEPPSCKAMPTQCGPRRSAPMAGAW